MFEMSHYFTSFLTEMQSYLDELRQQIEYLHMRAATDEQSLLLRRLGHTIAGLTKTVDLPDFAGLGEALDETAARFLAAKAHLTKELAAPLTQCAAYFSQRLAAMATAGNFIEPIYSNMRDADAIAVALIKIAPSMYPGLSVTGIHQPYTAEPDATESADEPLTSEAHESIAAFLRAHLRQPTVAAPAPLTPAAISLTDPEVLSDFIIEMGDDLAQISQRLLVTATGPTTADLRFLGEIAHKLKGAAAMVGMLRSAAISEMFESVVIALRQKRVAPSADVMRWLLDDIEALETLHTQIKRTGSEGESEARYIALQSVYTQLFVTSQSAPTRPRPTASHDQAHRENDQDTAKPGDAERHQVQVRIDVQRLDQIMNTINSFMSNRIAMKRLHTQAVANEQELPGVIARIIALSDRLRTERVETLHSPTTGEGARTASQPLISTRLAERRPEVDDLGMMSGAHDLGEYAEFDQVMTMVGEVILDLRTLHFSLQTALNQIWRYSEHLDFFTESIQRDLLDLRLVPFSAMAGRLEIVARSTALRLNKDVDFVLEGAAHEIDREISTIIADPLVQLIRNAVVHGIETPTERFAADKLEPARVVMSVTTAGDEIAIDISDNGRGINPHQIAAELLARGDPRMTLQRARAITMNEAYEFILSQDFSMAAKADSLAGSGTGLPYVKRMIQSVHGSLHINSETGVGTTFHIHLPMTLGILRALSVYTGVNGYAIPAGDIRRMAEITPAMIHLTPQGAMAAVPNLHGGATEMRVMTLPHLLGHAEIATTGTTALVIAVDDVEYAIIIERFGIERDMVVRKVPPHLHRRDVRGASITADGEVLLILSLPALINKARASRHFDEQAPRITHPLAEPAQGDYILVVDDSPSIRRGLEYGLTQAGYPIELASDGVAAIEQMTRSRPRLIILDIEMPNLNGYELLDVIRANAQFHDLRVIMLTSQAGSRHRERALALGAVGYLAKPVTTEDLLGAIERALDPSAQTAYNQREETS